MDSLPCLDLSELLFQRGVSVKNTNRMANSVDPDEIIIMSRFVRIYTICKRFFWSAGQKGLTNSLYI